jgi:hypothetical protein
MPFAQGIFPPSIFPYRHLRASDKDTGTFRNAPDDPVVIDIGNKGKPGILPDQVFQFGP